MAQAATIPALAAHRVPLEITKLPTARPAAAQAPNPVIFLTLLSSNLRFFSHSGNFKNMKSRTELESGVA